jgi:general secretion pathway protein E/type IV pilus assembly protein PilB
MKILQEYIDLLTREQAWHYRVIPTKVSDNLLELCTDRNGDANEVLEELEMILGKDVKLSRIGSAVLEEYLRSYYPQQVDYIHEKVRALDLQSENFLSDIIEEANSINSSDIHIEAFEERCRIRMRIDGQMIERYSISKSEYPILVNKIKIMSNLDISEKRLPQDGRIFFNYRQTKFDIRVSVLPALHGEKIVLRLLGSNAIDLDLQKLGFTENEYNTFLEGLKKPNGIILISGPTGSGKTTTLYATLRRLNKSTRNILTIEDPIEYTLEGINQVQLKEAIGFTFAKALKTFLRQDPDIIMLGEIRDSETANMAIRAALTGHLVLSTVHTNSAWDTITRLIDMGVPAFLLAGTINLTVAQRLIRKLCPHCKKRDKFDYDLLPKAHKLLGDIDFHYKKIGCAKCLNTGYMGRKAIYEIIPVDNELSGMIKKQELEIGGILAERGVKTLADNAMEFFKLGETTIEEVYPYLLS